MWSRAKTVPSGVELVELDELRRHLRLGDCNDHDATLLDLLAAAVDYGERCRSEAFLASTWEVRCDSFYESQLVWGDCAQGLRLPVRPLRTVESVQYVDPDGATQTWSSGLYRVHAQGPTGWIEPAYGESWPATRQQTAAVIVTATAGYATTAAGVPEFLRIAVKRLVAEWFEHREATVTGTINTPLPMSVESLFDVDRLSNFG